MCAKASASSRSPGTRVPRVGIGCLAFRGGRLLLVRNHEGFWSTPGGHLKFGETPDACAARETAEETGVEVTNLDFVAISSDFLSDPPRHYVTIWMRGDAGTGEARVGDSKEVAEVGWFEPTALPSPLFRDFANLVEGRCWPPQPANLPR
jgi:8-oxo-dGTP diphosphatase